MKIDMYQGQTESGEDFGYVCGDDGGYFFTWRSTLDRTIDSVEEDSVDGDGGLDISDVIEHLRKKLPCTARGRAMWGEIEE